MKYALFVLSFVATQVFATGSNHHNVYDNSVVNRGGNAVSDSYSNSTSGAYSGSTSNSNATSNSTSEGGNATGGNSDSYANNGGNSMNMSTMNNAPRQYHNTPALSSLFGTPTAPCALPVGGTGAGAGFGFGFITAYINEECIKQETTKLAIARGRDDTGQEIFCTMEHAKNTTECRELQSKLAKREPAFISIKEEKTGLFGTTWDDTTKQWVFNTTR